MGKLIFSPRMLSKYITILAFSLPQTAGMEKKDALRRVYKLAAGIDAGEEVCRTTDRSALCPVAYLRA
jgi:hypothetical protein